MKFTLPSDTYNSSQLATRNILKQPKNPEILDLYKASASKNTIIHSITQPCSCSSINQLQKVCEALSQNIFIFVRKAIILQLANNTNLLR